MDHPETELSYNSIHIHNNKKPDFSTTKTPIYSILISSNTLASSCSLQNTNERNISKHNYHLTLSNTNYPKTLFVIQPKRKKEKNR